MKFRNFCLVIIFSSFLCLVIACAAKKPSTEPAREAMVFNAGQEMEQPAPAPEPLPVPAPEPNPYFADHRRPALAPAPLTDVPDGLVLITIQAQSPLEACITDIGYEYNPQSASSDGMVYMAITPGSHQVNCSDTQKKVAVDRGVARYSLWVNNVKLYLVDPDIKGGMYYFYVYEDGRVLPTKP